MTPDQLLVAQIADGATHDDPARRQSAYWDQVHLLPDINAPRNDDGFALVHYAVRHTHVLRDVLRRGGDPNLQTACGHVPLHMAVQRKNVDSVRLLLESGANPNVVERAHRNSPLWYATMVRDAAPYVLLLRKYGADPLSSNRHGGTPLGFIEERLAESDVYAPIHEAMTRQVDLQPGRGLAAPTQAIPVNPADLTDPRKVELRRVWAEHVPARGQALTVQGELLRCIARLDDEANRNGNINYSRGHTQMRNYVRSVLIDPSVFDAETLHRLDGYLSRIRKTGDALIGDDTAWEHLNNAVADWCLAHPEPIPREDDPKRAF